MRTRRWPSSPSHSPPAPIFVFSVVNALWLRPLPVEDPDRVVVIGRDFDIPDGSRYSELGLEALRQMASFQSVAGQTVTSGLFAGMRPRVALAALTRPPAIAGITPQFFAVLGLHVTGREFETGDGEAPGAVPAVISDDLWRSVWQQRGGAVGFIVPASPVDLRVVASRRSWYSAG